MATLVHWRWVPVGSHRDNKRLDVKTASTLRRKQARPGGDQATPTTVLVDCSAAIEKSSRFWGAITCHSARVKRLTRIRVMFHSSWFWGADDSVLDFFGVYQPVSSLVAHRVSISLESQHTRIWTYSPAAMARSPSADQERASKQEGENGKSTGLSIVLKSNHRSHALLTFASLVGEVKGNVQSRARWFRAC